MKQTAVEFLDFGIRLSANFTESKSGRCTFKLGISKMDSLYDEAKQIEEKQKDEFAIGFAIWCDTLQEKFPYLGVYEFNLQFGSKSIKELLEIYKKEL